MQQRTHALDVHAFFIHAAKKGKQMMMGRIAAFAAVCILLSGCGRFMQSVGDIEGEYRYFNNSASDGKSTVTEEINVRIDPPNYYVDFDTPLIFSKRYTVRIEAKRTNASGSVDGFCSGVVFAQDEHGKLSNDGVSVYREGSTLILEMTDAARSRICKWPHSGMTFEVLDKVK